MILDRMLHVDKRVHEHLQTTKSDGLSLFTKIMGPLTLAPNDSCLGKLISILCRLLNSVLCFFDSIVQVITFNIENRNDR